MSSRRLRIAALALFVLSRGVLVLCVLGPGALAGCTRSLMEGPPYPIVAEPMIGEAEYGVIEIHTGECVDGRRTGELVDRQWFPATPDGPQMRDAVAFPEGEDVCVRVFALAGREDTPPLPCSIVAVGARTVTPGVTDERPLVVTLSSLSAERTGLLSERDEANRSFAEALCPPRPTAPFEGERVGALERPTFRFAPGTTDGVTCLLVRSADGPFAEEVPAPVDDGAFVWDGAPLPVDGGPFEWSLRTCPDACPGAGVASFVPESARCTALSPPRTFVTRPWGDLDDDPYEDFALGTPFDEVYVFRSEPGPTPETTYDICGVDFSITRISLLEDTPPADCGTDGPIGTPQSFYGIGLGMFDVGDDPRAELLIGAANCHERVEPPATRPFEGGGTVFLYDPDLAQLPPHFFGGDPNELSIDVFGLDFEPAFRSGAAASDVTTLGGEVVGGIIRYQLSTSPVLGARSLGDDQRVEHRGYVTGHGDLDGDGFADLSYRELLRFAQAARAADPYDDVPNPLQGTNAVLLGDTDGDGRGELLLSAPAQADACDLGLRLVELQAREAGDARFEELLTIERTLPRTIEVDCMPPPPMMGVPPPLPAECSNGVCAPDDRACPVCRLPVFSEGMLATAMPHGAAWTPTPDAAALAFMRGDEGVVVVDVSGNERVLGFPFASSRCLGIHMRGLYDLDGDGRDELLVLDPVQNQLNVVCGDGDGRLEAIVNQASIPAPFEPAATAPGSTNGCHATWSFAP